MSSVPQPAQASKGSAAAREAARWPPDEHDGLSEHPPAAVLLLVLGEATRELYDTGYTIYVSD